MSIERTRTCRRCQFEGPQDTRCCKRCGAELTALSGRSFLIVAGVAAAPLIVPTLLAPGFDSDGAAFGGVIFILLSTLLMGVYLVVGASISAALFLCWKNGSAARSVLVGLGLGLALGAGSCTSYLAATS